MKKLASSIAVLALAVVPAFASHNVHLVSRTAKAGYKVTKFTATKAVPATAKVTYKVAKFTAKQLF